MKNPFAKKKKASPEMEMVVPVELCFDDLIVHLAQNGVRKFAWNGEKTKAGNVFTLRWNLNGEEQYASICIRENHKAKSFRKTLAMFCRQVHKRIKAGEFERPAVPAVLTVGKEGSA
jgi:hypothetical protein